MNTFKTRHAALCVAALLAMGSALADEHKPVADGAAKGQATEGTVSAPGSPEQPMAQGMSSGKRRHSPADMAVKGTGVPQNSAVQIHRQIDKATP